MAEQNTPKHTLDLTDEEVFTLQIALGQLQSTTDYEFRNVVRMAVEIENRLPRVNVRWEDVEAGPDTPHPFR